MAATKPAQKLTPPPRPSMAMADDPAYALQLAPNLAPDVDIVITEGIAAFGVKGAGKSTVCARLVEQISRYPIPFVVFDTKGEYLNLAHPALAVIATAQGCPSGYDILHDRLRVVVDLRSWDTDEAAALAMAQMLRELFAYAGTQADPEPCPLFIDEAQYWLPQRAVTYLSKETARELRDAWHIIGTRGRSLGLTPNYFTQNISELDKSVMRQAGIYILMRQVLDNDLDRYLEYIRYTNAAKTRNAIRAFSPGRAIVLLPSGEQISTTFYQRTSVHPSKTPTVRGVMARQAQGPQPAAEATPRTRGPRKEKAPELSPATECIYQALEQDSGLSPYELMQRTGCTLETAKEGLVSFFYGPSAPTLDPA